MDITLVNGDPYGNNFRVTDSNAGNMVIFNEYIEANGERQIQCRENDSGYGNVITYQDNNQGVGRSFLKNGDRINL